MGERLRLFTLALRDRRSYSQSLDGTATHAIIRIRGLAQSGQHHVNQEYLEEAARQSSANAVIEQRILDLNDAIAESRARMKLLDGRRQDAEKKVLEGLQQSLGELKNQLAANTKRIDALGTQAQQALDSWVTYYNILASTYIRIRMRGRQKIAPAQAEIPAFEPIKLFELDPPKGEGGRRA